MNNNFPDQKDEKNFRTKSKKKSSHFYNNSTQMKKHRMSRIDCQPIPSYLINTPIPSINNSLVEIFPDCGIIIDENQEIIEKKGINFGHSPQILERLDDEEDSSIYNNNSSIYNSNSVNLETLSTANKLIKSIYINFIR